MNAELKAAFELIESALFCGDSFHNEAATEEAETYLERWERQFQVIKRSNFFEGSALTKQPPEPINETAPEPAPKHPEGIQGDLFTFSEATAGAA